MLRRRTKRAAERILSRPPAAWIGRVRTRGRSLILAYHNVIPDEVRAVGEPALHLPVSDFARQLDHLREVADVVSLESLLTPHERVGLDGRAWNGRPRVAVTFDDAYLGAVTLGVSELAARRMPATVFVAPGILGGRTLWWDALPWPHDPHEARRLRTYALEKLGGREGEILPWMRGLGLEPREVPALFRTAPEGVLGQVSKQPGVTFGSHGWSHCSLAHLSYAELRSEIEESWEWLAARLPRVVPWISYPYGLTSSQVRQVVRRVGYRGGLLVEGGWLSRSGSEDPFAVSRMNVPAGISLAGFEARLAGFLAAR